MGRRSDGQAACHASHEKLSKVQVWSRIWLSLVLLSCKIKAPVAACSGKELAWVILTSSNLSIAAWGKLEKRTNSEHEGSQLYIMA